MQTKILPRTTHPFFLFIFLLLPLLLSAQSPKFSGPGGPVGDPSVNPATGEVNLTIPLETLSGAGSPDYGLSLSYNSTAVELAAQVWNDEVQASTIGLGWSLNHPGRIRRDNSGTGDESDDIFYLDNRELQFVRNKTGDPNTWLFNYKAAYSLDVIEYHRENNSLSYWLIKDASGNTAIYGGDTTKIVTAPVTNAALQQAYTILTYNQTAAVSNCATGSMEYGVKWGDWIGVAESYSYKGANQDQQVIGWNLRSYSDKWNNTTKFYYVQHVQNVGPDANAKWYTKACYLYRVDGANKESVQVFYCSRTQSGGSNFLGCDNIIGQRYADFIDPWTRTPEPDAYQECYDVLFLGHVNKLKNGDDDNSLTGTTDIKYEYAAPGGDANMAKLMLKEIHRYNVFIDPTKQVHNRERTPSYLFDYYGPKDKLLVTRSGADPNTGIDNQKIYDSVAGAVYGKLKSYTNPTGEKRTYCYSRNDMKNMQQSIPISNSLKTNRSIVYGNDYAVICSSEGAAVYTWSATGWQEIFLTSVGKPKVDKPKDVVRSVYADKDFFLILNANKTLYFVQQDVKSGLWKIPQEVTSNVEYFSACSKTMLLKKNDASLGAYSISSKNELQFITGLTSESSDSRLIANEYYFGELFYKKGDEYHLTFGFWPFDYESGVVSPFSQLNDIHVVNKEEFGIRAARFKYSFNVTCYPLYNIVNEKLDAWTKIASVIDNGYYMYIKFPIGLYTVFLNTFYATGNNGSEVSFRMVAFHYNRNTKSFDVCRDKYPDGDPFHGSFAGTFNNRSYNTSSIGTNWGIGHTAELFSGGGIFSPVNHYSTFATFPGSATENQYSYYDKGEDYIPDNFRAGSFFQIGGSGDVLPTITKDGVAAYYRYDPHGEKWYSLGNSPTRTFTKIPVSTAYTVLHAINETIGYAFLALGLADPVSAVVTASLVGMQIAEQTTAPKSLYSVDPTSFSLGRRYLNDANSLWYITHDGGISPLGTDFTNRASVLTGFDANNELKSYGSSLGSGFVPFTVRPQGTNNWASYIRILRNGSLGKFVKVEDYTLGTGASPLIFSDEGDGTTMQNGMFITYGELADSKSGEDKNFYNSSGAVYLHRFMLDQASGNPYHYAVNTVTIEDGFNSHTTAYEYNQNKTAFAGTAYYGDVTIYPGGKGSGNGYVRNYYHIGASGEPVVQLVDTSTSMRVPTISSFVPASSVAQLILGNTYKTEFYQDGQAGVVSSSERLFQIDQTAGLYSVNTLSQMNNTDSQVVFERNYYNIRRQLSNHALSSKNIKANSFIAGSPETYTKTIQTSYKYAWEFDKAIAKANLYDLIALTKTEELINDKPINSKPQYTYTAYRDWTGNGTYAAACNYYSIPGPVMGKSFVPAVSVCPLPSEVLPAGLSWETANVILDRTSQGNIVQSADPKTALYKTIRYVKYNDMEYPQAVFSNKDQQKTNVDPGYNFYVGAEAYETVAPTLSNVVVTSEAAFTGLRSYGFQFGPGTIKYSTSLVASGPVVCGFWAMASGDRREISVNGKKFSAKQYEWTYIQTILNAAEAKDITISSTKIYVDDISVHPLDGASFTANVYDFAKLNLTAKLTSDGGNIHQVYTETYNEPSGSYAVANDTSVDMKISTAPLTGFSRWNGGRYKIPIDSGLFRTQTPNTVFSIVSNEYAGSNYFPPTLAKNVTISNLGQSFYLKIMIDQLQAGDKIQISSLNDPSNIIDIRYNNRDNLINIILKDYPSKTIPLPVSEAGNIAIAYMGQSLLLFYADKLLYSQYLPFVPGTLNSIISGSDGAFFVKNPQISGIYMDAAGRSIQNHSIALDYSGKFPIARDIISTQIYDGWGNVAVQTKPSDPNSLPLDSKCINYSSNITLLNYCSDLVKDFNWATYRAQGVNGAARRYWEQEKDFWGFDAVSDGSFAYLATLSTPSPLNRNIKSSVNYGKSFSLDGNLGKNDNTYNSSIARDLAFDLNIKPSSSNLRFGRHLGSDTMGLYVEHVNMTDAVGDLDISIISGIKDGLRNESITSASMNILPDDGSIIEQDNLYLTPNTFDDAEKSIQSSHKKKVTTVPEDLNIDKEYLLKINTDLMFTNAFSAEMRLVYLTFEDGGKTYCTRYDTLTHRFSFFEHTPASSDVPASLDDWAIFATKNVAFLAQYGVGGSGPIPSKATDSVGYFLTFLVVDSTGELIFFNPADPPPPPLCPFYSRADATTMKNYDGSRCLIVKRHAGKYTYFPQTCLEKAVGPSVDTSVFKNFITKSSAAYGGRVSISREPDMLGPTYTFKDPLGRVRFVCSNYDPKEKVSNGALYYLYDHLGRVIETGTLKNTAGDISFYLQKSSDPASALTDNMKCVKSRFVYDAAYDLTQPFDFTKGPQVFMPLMKNMQGELFAVIKNQSDIPDRPTATGGDTTSRVINYYWNKGNQWNGLNVVSSAIQDPVTKKFDFRNTYYEYDLNTQKVAYPDRNTGQFEIKDSQKRVLYTYDAMGNLSKVCNGMVKGNTCNGTIYADSFRYYITGALKTYVFNDAKLRYNAQYDKLFRLRSLSTTNLLNGEEIFREKLNYEKDSTGAGYQGGNIIQAVYSGTGLKANGNNFEEIYNYDYDIFNRLTGAQKRSLDGTLQQTFTYSYDPNGNMTSSQVKDGKGSLTSNQSFSYTNNTNRLDTLFDGATNKNQVYGYGDSSEYNNIGGAVKTISYLTGRTLDSTMTLNTEAKTDRVTRIDLPSTKIYYTYDALGRLIRTDTKPASLLEQIQKGTIPLLEPADGRKMDRYYLSMNSFGAVTYWKFTSSTTAADVAVLSLNELYNAIESGAYTLHFHSSASVPAGAAIGNIYIYKNAATGNRIDMFILTSKVGGITALPVNATSNSNWRFIDSVPRGSEFERKLLLKF